jgi:hypothetical protein
MVENSIQSSRGFAHCAALAGAPSCSVRYGITAVRLEGTQVCEVMMGMIDPSLESWDHRPAPTRLVEVVDRLVEGDTVFAVFPTESGCLRLGPEVKVDVLPGGAETLAAGDEQPGRSLADLPRF